MLRFIKIKCEHCSNNKCYIEEKIAPNLYQYRCFYCGCAWYR